MVQRRRTDDGPGGKTCCYARAGISRREVSSNVAGNEDFCVSLLLIILHVLA